MKSFYQNMVMLGALVMSVALIMDAPVVRAQSGGSPPAATQPDKKRLREEAASVDPNILAGPKVEEDAELRDVGRPRPDGGVRPANDAVPFGAWVTALRGLGLSPQQGASIRQIAREFEDKARAFRDSQPEDVKRLMRETRQAREQGMPPPPEARERLARIESDMPRPQPYQERIWALLTKEQQEQMKAKLDEMRSEMGRRENPREMMSPSDMNESNSANQSASELPQPAKDRPRANRRAWRFWLLNPVPVDSQAEPAASQPTPPDEPMMTGQP